mmetsp:Transcript_9778/g.17279  ORF Transcript_9778/g.17279 Transcript_9778/m.17279 type:complete len:311 (-) Transcript_9778:216-1148(-)
MIDTILQPLQALVRLTAETASHQRHHAALDFRCHPATPAVRSLPGLPNGRFATTSCCRLSRPQATGGSLCAALLIGARICQMARTVESGIASSNRTVMEAAVVEALLVCSPETQRCCRLTPPSCHRWILLGVDLASLACPDQPTATCPRTGRHVILVAMHYVRCLATRDRHILAHRRRHQPPWWALGFHGRGLLLMELNMQDCNGRRATMLRSEEEELLDRPMGGGKMASHLAAIVVAGKAGGAMLLQGLGEKMRSNSCTSRLPACTELATTTQAPALNGHLTASLPRMLSLSLQELQAVAASSRSSTDG